MSHRIGIEFGKDPATERGRLPPGPPHLPPISPPTAPQGRDNMMRRKLLPPGLAAALLVIGLYCAVPLSSSPSSAVLAAQEHSLPLQRLRSLEHATLDLQAQLSLYRATPGEEERYRLQRLILELKELQADLGMAPPEPSDQVSSDPEREAQQLLDWIQSLRSMRV